MNNATGHIGNFHGSQQAAAGFELLATSPTPIVHMCVFKDRLFVATGTGVFERCEDGVFRECRLEPAARANDEAGVHVLLNDEY